MRPVIQRPNYDYLQGKEMERFFTLERTQKRMLAMHTNYRPTCPKHSPVKGYEPRFDGVIEKEDDRYFSAEMWYCPVCKEYFALQDKKRKIRPFLWARPWYQGLNRKTLEFRDKLTELKLLHRRIQNGIDK